MPDERERAGLSIINDGEKTTILVDGQPLQLCQHKTQSVTAGEFLWYVARIILVLSLVALLAGWAFGQGLSDDNDADQQAYSEQQAQGAPHPAVCLSFSAVRESSQADVDELRKRGVDIYYTLIEGQVATDIAKVIDLEGAAEVDGLYVVEFPDQRVLILFRKNENCIKGLLPTSAETWARIKTLVYGQSL